ALSPDESIGFWLWDGRELQTKPVPELAFFTTSSVQPAEVRVYRNEHFSREMSAPPFSAESLERFHRDEAGQASAFDVRMSRSDARSVSLTRISHRPEASTMHYAPREGDGLFAEPKVTALAGRLTTPNRTTT
ncbi:MAG TPA: hypothetical protein VJ952_09270, partial [Opitutales bacterium]|nr:hypothetical protein [Opitutales bacterium]